MVEERRRFPRLVKPLDATWLGASGGSPCRVADIGMGGCFVQTAAQPAVGDRTVVTATIGLNEIEFAGEVRYLEPSIGFGMEFDLLEEEQVAILRRLLDSGAIATNQAS